MPGNVQRDAADSPSGSRLERSGPPSGSGRWRVLNPKTCQKSHGKKRHRRQEVAGTVLRVRAWTVVEFSRLPLLAAMATEYRRPATSELKEHSGAEERDTANV